MFGKVQIMSCWYPLTLFRFSDLGIDNEKKN